MHYYPKHIDYFKNMISSIQKIKRLWLEKFSAIEIKYPPSLQIPSIEFRVVFLGRRSRQGSGHCKF